MSIISSFEQVSGQPANLNKTELSFCQNVPDNNCNLIQDRIGAMESHACYLSLPTCIGRSKKEIFTCLQDRLGSKIKGWKERCLSRAAKEVLLKSIAQHIPIYVMSCFKVPISVCDNLHSMMANFCRGIKRIQFTFLLKINC